jgi:hypothetical protein
MQTKKSKLVQVSAAALAFTALFTASAFAAHKHHHHAHYHALTVRQQAAVAPDPYHGPGAPFTAPVAIAGTVVGLPFQAAGQIFPYQNANSPLVLIGVPVHVLGGIVQMPFYVVNSALGMSPASPF